MQPFRWKIIRAVDAWRRWGGFAAPAALILSGALLVALQPAPKTPIAVGSVPALALQAVFYGSLLGWLAWALLRARLSALSKAFWLVFMVLAVWYASGTRPWQRSYDWNGHDDYVQFIVDRQALPKARSCWICYHPPLYYMAAAPVYRVFRATPLGHPADEMQFLSVGIFGLFLLYFLLLVESTIESDAARLLACLALAAAPTTVINSARIGNDILLYLFWMGATFHTVRWERDFARRDLMIAAAYLGLGFITKGNAAVPVLAFAATLVMAFAREPGRRRDIVGQGVPALAIVGLGAAAYLFWSRHFILSGLSPNSYLLANSLKIEQTALNQLAFDVKAFVMEFAEPHNSLGARENFLNFFFKTSILGDWTFTLEGARATMRLLSAAYVAAAMVLAVMLGRALRVRGRLPGMFSSILVIAPLMTLAHRWHEANVTVSDARYVYPMFAVAAIVYVLLLEKLDGDGQVGIYRLGVTVLCAFICFGAAFQTALFLSLT